MPAVRLTSSAPVRIVRDFVAAAGHYRDALGFAYDHCWGEPPNFVILHRDGYDLGFRQPL
jgi:hypothetical protein